MPFAQTFDIHDILVIGMLIVLEGVLSIDNALVLGLLAKPLPQTLQKRALTYGLIGAFAFRFIAIATAAWLLHWRFVKLLGGGYLIGVAIRHFFFTAKETDAESTEPAALAARAAGKFWPTVIAIELTDIAFAVDSIVAAIGVVGPPPDPEKTHPKLWVVIIGGFLGVVLMRYAAVLFIKLLNRFPRFETAAYLLVIVIGGKLVADWAFNSHYYPDRLDFHTPANPAFWVFWIAMLGCFCVGFIPQKESTHSISHPPPSGQT